MTVRALLAGALGGVGALAATAIGRVAPVRAAEGDTLHAGDELTRFIHEIFEQGNPEAVMNPARLCSTKGRDGGRSTPA